MLDGLLGRGFSPKCKSLIKATKTRIEVLRRRSEAKQRFLKEDLAKLLANGLDINAFGRTEEFLAGMCLLSCYDFIEYSCEYILKWLSTMQKQRECPEECREPVSSLMFAAARFSDLPELRDLRDTFLERYGNSLEYFANHVFVEKLASRPPTMEKKIQLLQDISSEFSIKWDSKGFEKRMANPPAFTQDQPRKYGPSPVSEDKYALSNGNNSSTKSETTSNGHKPLLSKAETIAKRDTNEVSFRGRRDFSADKHNGSVNRTEDTNSPLTAVTPGGSSSSRGKRSDYVDARDTVIQKGETKDPLSHRKGSDRVDGRNPMSLSDWVSAPKVETRDPLSSGKGSDHSDCRYTVLNDRATVSKAEKDRLSIGNLEDKRETPKSYYNTALPPPYVKAKDNPNPNPNPNPPYIKQKGTNYGARTESNLVSHDLVESSKPDQDHQNHIPLPKPRSVRRKNSKSSSSNHGETLNSEEGRVVKRTSSSRRKEHSRRGLQILFDDEHYQKDEEERMMDKLLLHYSKKSSNYDITKLRKKSEVDRAVNTVPVPTRSVSLPHESPALSEGPKVFARASSFDEPAPHVHPKLPNYDDLAAQFAALRGR